jgi:ribosomal 50S subunit-recycling heat shock protein
MRIDLVLKYLCLAKSRSMAKALCERDAVILNGDPASASATVRAGDRVTVRFPRRDVSVVIDRVPEKQLSKANALAYYRSVDVPAAERRDDPLADL